MKKKLHIFIFLTIFASTVIGQVPTYFNSNVNTGGNAFPLANGTTSRKVQWFIPPNNLTGAPTGFMITDVYFQCAAAGSNTYPIINIKLKQGTGTGLTGAAAGPVEPGMTVVYSATNLLLTGTAGNWMKFTLQTPWLYDTGFPLIVELEHNAGTTSGPTVAQAVNIPGPGNGRQWADYNAANITGIGANQINFGIDVAPATPCAGIPNGGNALVSTASVCPGNTVSLSMSTSYFGMGGINYQWQSSTTGVNGLYTSVPNATASTLVTGTLAASTAYRALVTCTNGIGLTTTITPVLVNVGAPIISNVTSPIPLLCPGLTSSLSLSTSYQGVTYQWQTSNVSVVGPYLNVANGGTSPTSGTASAYVSPVLTNTTYFQAVVSCTAVPSFSSVITPITINIAGTTTNTIPYNEGFEGVGVNNYMPNCSWSASSPTLVCQTYAVANTFNRTPNNGSRFASFKSPTSANGDYFYTNGIKLEPGITYSASLDYIADGALGWTELSLWVGTSQSVPTLTNIVSVSASMIANTYYKNLSNTFTVGTSGFYYVAVKGKGTGANYLTYDDLSITAPCSINSPTMAVTGPTAVCSGQPFIYSASGADTYLWTNNGVTTSTVSLSLGSNANIIVVGTNSASSCSSTLAIPMVVNQSPPVTISTTNTYVCKGSSITLNAGGALSYNWSSGSNNPGITVSPTIATSYTVVGINQNGCSSSAFQQISVKNVPSVSALSSANQMCISESVTLTATGANTYTWASNSNYIIGNQVVISPFTTTTYSVTGADASNCQGKYLVTVSVSECTGVKEMNASLAGVKLFPNPGNGEFVIEFSTDNNRLLEVLDLAGRVVLVTKVNGTRADINISKLSEGLYYVKIQENNKTSMLKVIKQ